ncbi:MAG: SusC/RagA family TonB-linked outer membrane protein, partial [Chitinophagaceae bacterium]
SQPNVTTYGGLQLFGNNFYNPLAVLGLQRNNNTLTRFLGNTYMNIMPIEGLTLTSKIGIDYWKNFEDQYSNPLIAGLGQANNGLVQTNNSTNLLWNWSNYANYVVEVKEHALNFIVGLEYQKSMYQDIYAGARDFSDQKFQDILSGTFITPSSGGEKTSDGFISYFGKIGYNYADRYYLDVSFRADAYSGFGSNNQIGYFPGISAAWRIFNEPFMDNTRNVLDDLKLRGSWGLVGNSNVGAYASRILYGGGRYADLNGQSIVQVGNPNLKWENSMKTDVGIDVSFLKGKLGVTFDYWRNDISNMLLFTPVPMTSGLPGGTLLTNIGEMYNQGIELSLSTVNVEIKGFRWSSLVNLTTVNNKVQKLSSSGDIIGSWSRASEGKPLGTYYLIEWAGVNTNNGFNGWYDQNGIAKYYNPEDKQYYLEDGTLTTSITASDAKYIDGKTGNPTWYGNFDNTFSYKGIDLTIGLQFSGGFWVYNATRATMLTNTLNNNFEEMNNRWQKPGDITNIPKLYIGDNVISRGSTQFLERGDFLRIRDITLGYNIPMEYLEKTGKLGIKSVRFYVRVSNVAILTKYTGADPELNTTANAVLAMGVDDRSVPMPRSYNIGLNITF